MTLVEITAVVEHIPLKTPFITALRRVETVEFVRVTLRSASGAVGIGEAPPTKAITGEDSNSILAALEHMMPQLTQRKFHDIDEAMALLHGSIPGNHSAKAAVDMAFYDLYAKEAGLPLYAYLGGEARTIPTDVTISLNAPETMAGDAAEALRNGFDILKVKVGAGDGRDAERLRAVRNAAGNNAILLIDANQAWSESETLAFIEAVADLDVALIEQPVPAAELDALARITAVSPVPILADESVFDLGDAEALIASHGADLINVKLMKCGGIHRAKAILEACRRAGVGCMMGSMLEGPVSIAAAMHLALAFPDTVRWHDLDSPLLYRTLPASAPLRFEGNRLTLKGGRGI